MSDKPDAAPATRRERERERHRREILDAADSLLAEKGLDALTMEEIAKRSEFAVGSLYRFFGSKEDLVEALIASHVDAFSEVVASLAGSPEPFEALLDRFLQLHAVEVQRNLPLVRFLLSGPRPLMPKGEEPTLLRASVSKVIEAVAALIEKGIREGVLIEDDPERMAVVLVSLVDGLSRSASLMGRGDLSSVLPVARRAFLDGHRRR